VQACIQFNFKILFPNLQQHRADTAPNSQTAAMLGVGSHIMTDIELNNKVIEELIVLNKKLPREYLRRNHKHYEYTTYISFIGTLFLCRDFEATNGFIDRATKYLQNIDNSSIDPDYLTVSKKFILNVTKLIST
jgi:hypothetical protein